jgi:hypothetical protein
MKKQTKKPIKSARKPRAKKPKPVPVNPVVVWEQEPEKDWLDRLMDKIESAWKKVFQA